MVSHFSQIQSSRTQFIEVFLAKNAQLNLSAIRDADGVFLKHISDTLEVQCALDLIAKDVLLENNVLSQDNELLQKELHQNDEKQYSGLFQKGQRLLDVGTGGGIPLLPLAITYPDIDFTGLDSVRKKTQAVADMASQLGLQNVHVVWSRVEEYHPTEQFDILTARAVAFSDQLFTWTYNLVKKGGYFVFYKMFSEEEESRIDSYVMQRKMRMIRKHYYKLFEEDIQRVIYIIEK